MAHNPEWHRAYAELEAAHEAASSRLTKARRQLEYKRRPANAEAEYAAALEASRAASKARWDFEMAATRIVNWAAA